MILPATLSVIPGDCASNTQSSWLGLKTQSYHSVLFPCGLNMISVLFSVNNRPSQTFCTFGVQCFCVTTVSYHAATTTCPLCCALFSAVWGFAVQAKNRNRNEKKIWRCHLLIQMSHASRSATWYQFLILIPQAEFHSLEAECPISPTSLFNHPFND